MESNIFRLNKYTVKKILKMSGKEIFYRSKKMVKNRINQIFFPGSVSEADFLRTLKLAQRDKESLDSLLNYFKNRQHPKFFFDGNSQRDLTIAYKKLFLLNDARAKADKILKNNLVLFGEKFKFGDHIKWQSNPVTDTVYPKKLGYKVPNDYENYGDVKYVWELNRCEFFLDLGRAYFLTKMEKYSDKSWDLIEDWIKKNTYLLGINWKSPLEIAVRSINWIFSYYYTLNSDSISPKRNLLFLKSINEHGHFLNTNLELYESPYNHLIGEAVGLSYIGILFPELGEAKKWKNRACRVLNENIPKQFNSDGGNIEQAFFYHHYCLGFLCLYYLISEKNGQDIPENVKKTIEKALDFSMSITKPDGKVPMIGDVDNARSIPGYNQAMWNFRDLLCIGTILFKRSDFRYVSRSFHESSLWLFGKEGLRQYNEIEPKIPKTGLDLMSQSGYCVMRSGWGKNDHYLLFDFGNQSAGLLRDKTLSAAHGHSDALSFVLSCYGKDILIDPAINIYNGSPEWETYFRSTEAHNTLKINEKDQAHYHGQMKWSETYDCKIKQLLTNDYFDYIDAEHNGYKNEFRIIHQRSILYLKPKYWIIKDTLKGDGRHKVESFFHFASDIKVKHDCQKKIIRADFLNKKTLLLFYFSDCSVDVSKAGTKPNLGWASYGYGDLRPAYVVRLSEHIQLPSISYTLIFPIANGSESFNIEAKKNERHFRSFQLENENSHFTLYSKESEADTMVIFDRSTDADYLIELHSGHGLILIGGTYFMRATSRHEIVNGFWHGKG